MKKLLTLFSSITLLASSATAVTACSSSSNSATKGYDAQDSGWFLATGGSIGVAVTLMSTLDNSDYSLFKDASNWNISYGSSAVTNFTIPLVLQSTKAPKLQKNVSVIYFSFLRKTTTNLNGDNDTIVTVTFNKQLKILPSGSTIKLKKVNS